MILGKEAIRLLIVDDEPRIRSGIRRDLHGYGKLEVVGEAGSVAEAVDEILLHVPDLVMLDVQLPDGTGFDVVRNVGPRQMPPVIFVTAFDQYAIRAFEVNAIDYILKPFDESRLRQSIDKAIDRRLEAMVLIKRLERLVEAHQQNLPQRIVVRHEGRFEFIPVDSIDWVESANNYIVLHCGNRTHIVPETLSSLESRLDASLFVRTHRGHIINLSRMVAVSSLSSGGYEVELRNGTRLPVGRQYREAIHALIRNRHA